MINDHTNGEDMAAQTFSLIQWQDEWASELMAYYAIGRRGNFQIRLKRQRMGNELLRAGFTNEVSNAAVINDVCDYAQLLLASGLPNHGDGWAKRL